MTPRGAVVNLLDRPLGRPLLAALTNTYARWKVGPQIGVSFDRVWVHRVGHRLYPDSPAFNYFDADLAWWPRQPQHDRDSTADYWFHTYRPRRGDTIVDIGAGKGEDVLTFAEEVGDRGRVVAVEAHPGTFATLQHLCRLNRLQNTTCLNFAAVDRPQVVHISSEVDWQSNAIGSSRAGATVAVPGETIDAICAQSRVGEIAFLKINIEGAETAALRGMDAAIQRVQCICVAAHDFRAERGDGDSFRTRTFVIEYLRAHGFAVTTRDSDPRDWVRDHVHGTRRSGA